MERAPLRGQAHDQLFPANVFVREAYDVLFCHSAPSSIVIQHSSPSSSVLQLKMRVIPLFRWPVTAPLQSNSPTNSPCSFPQLKIIHIVVARVIVHAVAPCAPNDLAIPKNGNIEGASCRQAVGVGSAVLTGGRPSHDTARFCPALSKQRILLDLCSVGTYD